MMLTLDELIAELQKQREQHGNCKVGVEDPDTGDPMKIKETRVRGTVLLLVTKGYGPEGQEWSAADIGVLEWTEGI
jgi:hypothetical protein